MRKLIARARRSFRARAMIKRSGGGRGISEEREVPLYRANERERQHESKGEGRNLRMLSKYIHSGSSARGLAGLLGDNRDPLPPPRLSLSHSR